MRLSTFKFRRVILLITVFTLPLIAQISLKSDYATPSRQAHRSGKKAADVRELSKPSLENLPGNQEEGKLIPRIDTGVDDFGKSIAQSNDMAVVGAPFADGKTGAAYVFKRNGSIWEPIQILHASDGDVNDYFGFSVAISGNTLAIGAQGDDNSGGSNAGALYVFRRDGDSWTEKQKLTASDGQQNAEFGKTVALLGTQVVVGAPKHDFGNDRDGQLYVFDNDGQSWTELQKLTPTTSTGSVLGSNFGSAIAVSSGTIVVGCVGLPEVFVFSRANFSPTYSQTQSLGSFAWGGDIGISGGRMVIGMQFAFGSGQAKTYTFDGTKWVFEQDLLPADRGAAFGISVQISGSTIILGDAEKAVYVFALSNGIWSEQSRLDPPGPNTEFGSDVSLFNDSLLVGDPSDPDDVFDTHPGTTYSYFYANGVWGGAQELTRNFQKEFTYYGTGVAIDGDTAVFGAPFENGGGAAYVFRRTGTVWNLYQRFTPNDGSGFAEFGASAAVQGNTLMIGAESEGAVYIYALNGSTWEFQQKVTADDPSSGSDFGTTLALDGDTVVIGARYYSDAFGLQGAAYIFVRNGNGWEQQAKLISDQPEAGERFGWDVALSGGTAVVGAWHDTMNGGFVVGSASVFVRNGTVWTLQQKLRPDPAVPQFFGTGVAINGDTIVVGAQNDSDDPAKAYGCGSLYIFERAAGVWSQKQKLFAPDRATDEDLGASVKMNSNTIVAGAPWQDNAGHQDTGAAYVFSKVGTVWIFNAKYVPSDAGDFEYMAEPPAGIAISGNTVIAGDYLANRDGLELDGAAYAFHIGPPPPLPNTLPGDNVAIEPQSGDATVTFSEVTSPGETTFTPIDPNSAGTAPLSYTLCPSCPAYNITTTAAYIPPVEVCLDVPASISGQFFNTMKLFHGENGNLVDVTTRRVTNPDGTRQVCGSVNSLSPFVIGYVVPTAARVSVSGRVTTAAGRGVYLARISLIDSCGLARTVQSNSFGYFRFEDVAAGESYQISIVHKLYSFEAPVQVVNVGDAIDDVRFIASR